MDSETKRALVLLRALIFHYHGLDLDEKKLLEQYVDELQAYEEYDWAISFISSDYLSAFERAREFLGRIFNPMSEEQRVNYLTETWEANHKKGYVTEMETTAMLNLAKDWSVEKIFLHRINIS
ncbi:MAG: hypothetical protein OEY56_02920 [Cyclobacteriaceae bacterium]|nr:hypothetical protein [Cyclobacteriaceae bacterium]